MTEFAAGLDGVAGADGAAGTAPGASTSDVYRGYLAQNPVLLAPMAGWTEVVFRSICKIYGSGLTCSEMISAQGLAYDNIRTLKYLDINPQEGSAVIQLFGSNPQVMALQASRIEELLGTKLAAIDINMGCPARKVVRKGEGSAMMKDPQLASQVISATVEAVSVPVTVKFRRGFEHGCETAVDFAKMAEQSGAAGCCVHGRYSKDLYHGESDWGVVGRVKDAVQIPVVASGDIKSSSDVFECMRQTGADAVMVARGAQGNPWIFLQCREIREHSGDAGDPQNEVPIEERIRVARFHVEKLAERDPRSVVHMRNFFSQYFKGVPAASMYRGMVTSCATIDDFEDFFDQMWSASLTHGYQKVLDADPLQRGAAYEDLEHWAQQLREFWDSEN